jgi:hypothetical protein
MPMINDEMKSCIAECLRYSKLLPLPNQRMTLRIVAT